MRIREEDISLLMISNLAVELSPVIQAENAKLRTTGRGRNGLQGEQEISLAD